MRKNLILSAAVGYNFNQIELFIKSLKKFNSDEICFIISKKDSSLEQELRKLKCQVIKTNISKKEIQFKRYEIFLKYLTSKNYKKILMCDSRDIYFQQNPFSFDYKKPINFFLEDHQIKNCPYNSNWLIKTYGKNEFKKISEKTILCSGTVIGERQKIIDYLKLITNHIKKFKYKKKLKYLLTLRQDPEGRGCDQGHANYIVHKSLINDIALHSNHKGPFATVFYLKDLNFDKNFQLINEIGEPYLLIHQYDKRWSEFSEAVNLVKRSLYIK